jgi:hypothetical protein
MAMPHRGQMRIQIRFVIAIMHLLVLPGSIVPVLEAGGNESEATFFQ